MLLPVPIARCQLYVQCCFNLQFDKLCYTFSRKFTYISASGGYAPRFPLGALPMDSAGGQNLSPSPPDWAPPETESCPTGQSLYIRILFAYLRVTSRCISLGGSLLWLEMALCSQLKDYETFLAYYCHVYIIVCI